MSYTFSDTWDYYQRLILSEKDKKAYATTHGRWKNHIKPILGDIKLDDFRSKQSMELRKHLDSKSISPQTVQHCLSLVRLLLNHSIEWELFTGQTPKFYMPKFDNQRTRYLTREEIQILLCTLKEKSILWHDISLFALNTGLRAGELLKLKAEHINKENNFLTVVDTKTAKNRTIPLNNTASAIILKYLKKRSNTEIIFHHKNKLPNMNNKIFSRAVERCSLNQGIKDRRQRIVFHSLRHTFASWLVQKGTPLFVVSQLLGHTNIKVTMRYAHLAPTQLQKAVNILPILE